jgi:phage gp16-like protein
MIISLKEARKLLGKDQSEKLSDEQLEKLIEDLDFLAKAALQMAAEDQAVSAKEHRVDSISSKSNVTDIL